MNLLKNGVDCSPGKSVFHFGWRKVRKMHIEKHPLCAACGYLPKLFNNDVHHVLPRHVRPDLAAEPTNLITLCRKRSCHIRVGHFDHYRKYWNRDIERLLEDGNVGERIRMAEIDFKESAE